MSTETLSASTFLNSYPNKKTRENYRLSISCYLKTIYEDNPLKTSRDLDFLTEIYFSELSCGRDYYHDLKSYTAYLPKKYSPTTTNLYLRSTCLWLEENGYALTRRERQRLFSLSPPPYPLQNEIELRRKLFRMMYSELPEKIGVLLLVLLGSGMRLGEALLLEKTDLDWSETRTVVSIRAETAKTKTPRTTYLTTEASEALLNYLRDRRDSDPRIFPFSSHVAQYHFRTTARKLGFSQTVNGKTTGVHWHMTRKWFISRFSLAANKDVAEHLAGHEGYLSRSYRRYTKKQMLKQFKKAEKELSILKFYEL